MCGRCSELCISSPTCTRKARKGTRSCKRRHRNRTFPASGNVGLATAPRVDSDSGYPPRSVALAGGSCCHRASSQGRYTSPPGSDSPPSPGGRPGQECRACSEQVGAPGWGWLHNSSPCLPASAGSGPPAESPQIRVPNKGKRDRAKRGAWGGRAHNFLAGSFLGSQGPGAPSSSPVSPSTESGKRHSPHPPGRATA